MTGAPARFLLPQPLRTALDGLPNAPYLVTDLVHLRARPPVPLWFDVLLFAIPRAAGILRV